LGKEVYNHL